MKKENHFLMALRILLAASLLIFFSVTPGFVQQPMNGSMVLQGDSSIDILIANEGATGTSQYKPSKLTGAPSTAIVASAGDTSEIVGIVTSASATTGNARIARTGRTKCYFDAGVTANHYVVNSPTTTGCHDGGATRPVGTQPLGRVLESNASAGLYSMTVTVGVPGETITSVFGRTGAVVATLADIAAGVAAAGTYDFSGAVLLLPASAGAAPTANGDCRFDTTQNALMCGGNGITGSVARLFYTHNCSTAGDCNTEANNTGTGGNQLTDDTSTSNEEWFNSKFTVPANTLIANKTIRVEGEFEASPGASPPGITISLYWGGTSGTLLMTTGSTAPAATGLAEYCFDITGTTTPGASVAIETASCIGSWPWGRPLTSQTISSATNADKVVILSGKWASNATNTHIIRLRQMKAWILN